MNEQGGFIVSIKTPEKIDFDRLLSSRYNIDVFQHSATFDEEKKQFIVDALLNLELIGQLVRDGYVVEVKAYHPAQGLPASQIVDITEGLKEAEKMAEKMAETDKAKKGKAKKGKAMRHAPSQEPPDPYEGGQLFPKFEYFTYEGFWQGLNVLHNLFPQTTSLGGLEGTHEGRVAPVIKIFGRTGTNRRGVLFIGGLHARELVNPDILLNLAWDLVGIHRGRPALKYGRKLFPNNTIKNIVNTFDIYIVPLANPDGRVYATNSQDLWRMNRNPNGGWTCSGPTCPDGVRLDGKGVDCNRNFDFLWNSGIMTKPDPCHCSQTYKGTSPFSEPDSRNIRTILDSNPGIDSMVDVHSYAERVLYPWQIDENQVTDINMNFRNPAYDGRRGVAGDSYKEYIPRSDLNRYLLDAGRVRDAINAVKGGAYAAIQGPTFPLYAASATSMDYAYSRNFVDSSKRKIFALSIETGKSFNIIRPENGQPAPTDGKWGITKEISAGLVQFLIQRLNP
jgi:carboxypeptidase T